MATKLFYRYVYEFRPDRVNERYTPSHKMGHQMFNALVTLNDEIVPDDKYRDLGGFVADYRFGFAEFNDEAMESVGWTTDAMKSKLEKVGSNLDLAFLSNVEMAATLRSLTTLTETEPNLFLVSEAVTEGPYTCEAKYIDCR